MKRLCTLMLLSLLLISCGGGGSSNDTKTKDPAPVPDKVALVFPEKDALCTQGIIIGSQSTVVLKWNAGANAESYDITLKNLLTGVTQSLTATATQKDVVLDLATPYSWSIISKSSKTSAIAVSDIWKFYNSGPGNISYAPYPADVTSPLKDQSLTSISGIVTLNWTGNDVDNDITGYDIYFGTTTNPLFLKTLTGQNLNVDVKPGGIYYWKILTKDSKGNTSDSGIYKFTVK